VLEQLGEEDQQQAAALWGPQGEPSSCEVGLVHKQRMECMQQLAHWAEIQGQVRADGLRKGCCLAWCFTWALKLVLHDAQRYGLGQACWLMYITFNACQQLGNISCTCQDAHSLLSPASQLAGSVLIHRIATLHHCTG
jgi:hypothetical protein